MQPAFVLHSRPYRNTSLLVDCFTPAHGRVPAVARGARRDRSRLRGLLQPFRPLLIAWRGRGELVTLTAAEDRGLPYWMAGVVLASAFYVNELLLRLLPRHDPHPALFLRYQETLDALAQLAAAPVAAQAIPLQRLLRLYEKTLLRELGFGMRLDSTAAGEPVRPEMLYYYHPDRGPVGAAAEAGAVPVSGRTLLALDREELDDPAVLREAKQLMRRLLEIHLGGRPLGSRELIEVYIHGGAAAPPPANAERDP